MRFRRALALAGTASCLLFALACGPAPTSPIDPGLLAPEEGGPPAWAFEEAARPARPRVVSGTAVTRPPASGRRRRPHRRLRVPEAQELVGDEEARRLPGGVRAEECSRPEASSAP